MVEVAENYEPPYVCLNYHVHHADLNKYTRVLVWADLYDLNAGVFYRVAPVAEVHASEVVAYCTRKNTEASAKYAIDGHGKLQVAVDPKVAATELLQAIWCTSKDEVHPVFDFTREAIDEAVQFCRNDLSPAWCEKRRQYPDDGASETLLSTTAAPHVIPSPWVMFWAGVMLGSCIQYMVCWWL